MTGEQVERATWALWRGGAGPILDRATAERLARAALEAALYFPPSFDEVVELVSRGRFNAPAATTGSPIQFITNDGVLCTITFDPATPPKPKEAPVPEGQFVLLTHQPGAIGAPDDNAYACATEAQATEIGHLLADGASPPMEFHVLPLQQGKFDSV